MAGEADWQDAEEAGYEPHFSFLVRDDFVLHVMSDDHAFHVGLEMVEAEANQLRERAKRLDLTTSPVMDDFGFEWEIQSNPRCIKYKLVHV